MKVWKLLFFFSVLLLIAVRFVWLDRFPVGINHDEAEVVLSSKTYWLFGTDTSSTKFPESIFSNGTEGRISGLPSFLLTPVLGWQDLSLAGVRMPFVLINLMTILLLSLLTWELTRDRVLSVLVFLVGLVNPWLFIYSRATTEAPFALFFVVSGIYVLFKSRGNTAFYSCLLFALAFYSYFGAKPVIILLVPLLLFIRFKLIGDLGKKFLLTFLSVFLLLVGPYFVYPVIFSGESTLYKRGDKDLVFSQIERFGPVVDEQRRASLDFPLKNLAFNKYNSLFREMFGKYIGWLSPDHLFLGGDSPSLYRFGEHGVVYPPDALFMAFGLAGLVALFKNKKQRSFALLTFVLLALGAVPPAVSKIGDSYFFRGFLLIPGIIYLIAAGVHVFLKYFSKSKSFVLVVLGATYILFFVGFLVFFFFRYPVKQQENHYLSGRVLANYLGRRGNEKTIVITTSPHATYHQYIFFSDALGVRSSLVSPGGEYLIDGIVFTKECEDFVAGENAILDARLNCDISKDGSLIIQDQKDAGFQYFVFKDTLCSGLSLLPFRQTHLVSDYSLEKLSDQVFCERWVHKWQEQ